MIIEVNNLKKTFKSYRRGSTFRETIKSLFVRRPVYTDAVKGISFGIEEGDIVAFLGPNGAGKSTTLKMLTGIMFPTSGTVNVMGYTPWRQRKQYVTKIGAVFGQKSQLLWDIPPVDAFALNKAVYNIPDNDFNSRLSEMTELLDVKDIIRKPTRQLSLGERMKCEFIMAMLHNPRIVFLDEPTIGLDVFAKEKIRQFILEMNKKGVTFILTTHDLSDVEQLARRVIVVNHGEVVFDDEIDAVFSHFGNKKLISVSVANELPPLSFDGLVEVSRADNGNVEFELDVDKGNLNEFIDYLSKTVTITDMSIQGVPIENIIKDLYAVNTNSK